MNLAFERRQERADAGAQRQLITLAVDTLPWHEGPDLLRSLLASVRGVEAVELDPTSARVWVFANGSVEPESLVERLESWGCGSYVLDDRFTVPQ
ncbi:MAG: hypothetical protein HY657_03760 [Acidobacteria bacterium]|nr:hypothetical protein [Acidobacteriota bacterium]